MTQNPDVQSMKDDIEHYAEREVGARLPSQEGIEHAFRLAERLSAAIDRDSVGDPVQMALDELVHDANPDDEEYASAINNHGPHAQVAFLVVVNGIEGAREAIGVALPDLDLSSDGAAPGMRR